VLARTQHEAGSALAASPCASTKLKAVVLNQTLMLPKAET
jgi:hypothetical protein